MMRQSFLRTIVSIAACIDVEIQAHRGLATVPRLQPLLQDLLLQDPQLQELLPQAETLPRLLQSPALRHL